MIDWNKPLEAFGVNIKDTPVTLVGKASGDRVVVEWPTGEIWSFTQNEYGEYRSGQFYKLRNCKAPWEVAWEASKDQPLSAYMIEKDYFKKVFELGRTWDENNKKS
jgi:hypothetical protein